jgi:hypothetical protein
MNSCPYCSYRLLRHISHREAHFFCRHCWSDVPDLAKIKLGNKSDIMS